MVISTRARHTTSATQVNYTRKHACSKSNYHSISAWVTVERAWLRYLSGVAPSSSGGANGFENRHEYVRVVVRHLALQHERPEKQREEKQGRDSWSRDAKSVRLKASHARGNCSASNKKRGAELCSRHPEESMSIAGPFYWYFVPGYATAFTAHQGCSRPPR